MKRRHPMRHRPNGVGAYHMYLGELLKKAKLGGKSKSERTSAFKKAQAKAVEMAKKVKAEGSKTKFGERVVAAAKSRNAVVQAKKMKHRGQRGRMVVAGPRGGKKVVPAMRKAAYKALKPYARLKVRKAAGAIVPRGPRKARTTAPAMTAKATAKPSTARPRRQAAARETKAPLTGTRSGKNGRVMYYLNGKLVSKATYEAATMTAKKATTGRKRGGKKGEQLSLVANPRRRKGARKAHRKMSMMRRLRNTGEGVLAAEKNFYGNLVSVPGLVSVVGVGIAHGVVAPMVADYLAQMLPSRIELPVVGSVGASNLAFTATGLVAGGALVGLGATVAKGQQALLNKMAMLAVGGGALIDIVGLVMNRGSYGAIDDNGNVYGAIDNDGTVYGDVVSYGGYEYAGLMEDGTNVSYGTVVGSEYADAMPADAEDSGADFNVAEGQALVEGPVAWLKRFGKSPVRATSIRGMKSRHAGREGHRWGWLIKLVGMDKAQQIAALPPQQRLEVLAKLRKAALESLANSMNAQAMQTTAQVASQNLLPAPQDAGLDLTGAVGAAGGAYGATMYAGGGY